MEYSDISIQIITSLQLRQYMVINNNTMQCLTWQWSYIW